MSQVVCRLNEKDCAVAKKSSAPQVTDAILAECLRKGLDGKVCNLQGGGANPGFFPTGAKGVPLVKAAREKGLIEDVPPPVPPGGKPPKKQTPHARLTPRGVQFVVDFDNPKGLLESLQAALAVQGQQLADGLKSVSGNVSQWQKELQQQEHDFQQALQNVSTVLAHLKEAPTRAAPSPSPAAHPPSVPSQPERHEVWLPEVVELVRQHKAHNSFSRPTLTEIYQELAKRHPRLTIGQFHDGLRTLSKERRILLTAYTLALATLEDPQTALYLDREVKYYVDLP
jgi:hypothetical protein